MPHGKKPKKLKKLLIDRIDLCDIPSNPDSYVALWKREDMKKENGLTVNDLLGVEQGLDDLFELNNVLMRSIEAIMMSEETDKRGLLKKTIKEFSERLESIKFGKRKGETMPKKFDKSQLPEEAQNYLKEVEETASQQKTELEAKLDEQKTQIETLTGEIEKLKTKEDPEQEIWKGVSPEVRKRVEEAEKKAQEADERVAKAEDKLKLEEFTKRATKEFPSMPIEDSQKGEVLKAVHEKLTKEEAELVERIFVSHEEMTKQAKALKAVGRDGTGNMGTAWEEICTKAEELVQKNEFKDIVTARDEVTKRFPDLAKRYREELKEARVN